VALHLCFHTVMPAIPCNLLPPWRLPAPAA
jgi:hypothetical protein